eukprot:TRINITY_DN23853_c0_g1_i2.p1 TRINITY_DN23853_c0_g1~~TRINITY_DN23853_c0_g1_i2.p1  ORF type:complete len:416 (-),score=65.71 TRINITY_DN23853_c0_g1_i2:93-1340(-)
MSLAVDERDEVVVAYNVTGAVLGAVVRVLRLSVIVFFFFFNDTATTEIYTLHIVGSVRCVQETGDILANNQAQYHEFISNNQTPQAKSLLEDNLQFRDEIHQIFCHSQFRLTQIVIFIIQFSRQRLQTQLDQAEKIINNNYQIISELDKKKVLQSQSKSLSRISLKKIKSINGTNSSNLEGENGYSPTNYNYFSSHKSSSSQIDQSNNCDQSPSSKQKNTNKLNHGHYDSYNFSSCTSNNYNNNNNDSILNKSNANAIADSYYFNIGKNITTSVPAQHNEQTLNSIKIQISQVVNPLNKKELSQTITNLNFQPKEKQILPYELSDSPEKKAPYISAISSEQQYFTKFTNLLKECNRSSTQQKVLQPFFKQLSKTEKNMKQGETYTDLAYLDIDNSQVLQLNSCLLYTSPSPRDQA